MIREISENDVVSLESLIQIYLGHKGEEISTETVFDQMQTGIKQERIHLVVSFDDDIPRGFSVISPQSHRIPILFSNWNSDIEIELFDYSFKILSENSPYILFESGYPTPWITEELSDHVVSLGFVKHDRAYMELDLPSNLPESENIELENYEFVPFIEELINDVSELVYRCVDGTVDQEIFPYVYSSVPKIKEWLKNLISSNYGTHKKWYSWLLRSSDDIVGGCFFVTRQKTAYLMHIVIAPKYRQKGLGRMLLNHSLNYVIKTESELQQVTLAVTLSNPAKLLYDRIGFEVANYMSTYIWTR